MDPDTRLGHDLLTSAVGGLNWYFSGHEHKLQFDFGVITTRLNGADSVNGGVIGGNVTLIEKRARLQYPIVFLGGERPRRRAPRAPTGGNQTLSAIDWSRSGRNFSFRLG